MASPHAINRRIKTRRGIASVEAAIIFPLLLTVIFGMIEYGWLLREQQIVLNTCREGARVGAMVDSTSNNVTGSTGVVTTIMSGYSLAGYTATLNPSNISSSNLSKGDTFTLTISIPYKPLLGITSLFPLPSTLTAAVTMEKEGS